MAKIPRTESLVAEHLLNEASSGDIPPVTGDNIGPGDNNLQIDWGRGNGGWTSIPAGFGLDFDDPLYQSGTNVAVTENNVVDYGTIGAKFGSAVTKACLHLVMAPRAGHSHAMRIVAIGSSTGNGALSVNADENRIYIRWNQETGNTYQVFMAEPHGGDPYVMSVYIDTEHASQTERIRVYFNGQRRGLQDPTWPPQNNRADFNNTSLFYSLGNRPAQDRNAVVAVYYVALRNDIDDEDNVAEIHAALLLNNNESPFGDTEPPEPTDALLFLGASEVDALKLGDSDVDTVYHGTSQVYP